MIFVYVMPGCHGNAVLKITLLTMQFASGKSTDCAPMMTPYTACIEISTRFRRLFLQLLHFPSIKYVGSEYLYHYSPKYYSIIRQTWPDRPYAGTSPCTQIFYLVAKPPVGRTMYATQEGICNEHQL